MTWKLDIKRIKIKIKIKMAIKVFITNIISRQNRCNTIITPPQGNVYIRNIKFEYSNPRINNLRVIPRITSIAFTR
jgi:hypothetical protein